MLDYLKPINDMDYDSLTFLPSGNKIKVEGNKFNEKSESVGGNEMGKEYHIILFKIDDEGSAKHLELFDAILTNPLEYISMLIPQDWYGMICKKTTTSGKFVDDVFDKFAEI